MLRGPQLHSWHNIINSVHFRVLMNVAGTSAATPTVAGIIALVNGERLEQTCF